jgi:HD-GYP domain-containing protein (c-di-GMP phosphodiesterase class II)
VSRQRRLASVPGAVGPGEAPFSPVPWSYLARLDEVPCDIFIGAGRRRTLYTTIGQDPVALRAKAEAGVSLWVRSGDVHLLRRMLTVSLGRTLADTTINPRERSQEAYRITAGILVGTFVNTRVDADEVSLVTDTVDLLTNVLSSDDESLWAMVAAMQRNTATHNHAINTAVYALALGKSLQITDFDRLRDIGRGAILMDLGLTTVPRRVLEQPYDELDPLERRAIQMHPQAGFAIVTRATGEVPSYAHVILEHHERLDGSGYPAGRRFGQISPDSQLVSIAEAFDALTNAGAAPYDALREMRFGHPGTFNTEVLASFIGLLGGWRGVRPEVSGAPRLASVS